MNENNSRSSIYVLIFGWFWFLLSKVDVWIIIQLNIIYEDSISLYGEHLLQGIYTIKHYKITSLVKVSGQIKWQVKTCCLWKNKTLTKIE